MEYIQKIINFLSNLKTDQIALISLAVTLLIFVLGKIHENKIKAYETRKEEYKKLVEFFLLIFNNAGKNPEKLANNKNAKEQYLEMGASLAVYGSKKLYKTYCFYRLISIDENIQKSKWYSKDMSMYCLGELFQIMRKEIGLNNEILKVDVPDILSFYITDFNKPEFKKNFYKYHFKKFLIKSALFWRKIENFLPLVWLSNYLFKPAFLILFYIIRFPIKLFIVTPIKQIQEILKKKAI